MNIHRKYREHNSTHTRARAHTHIHTRIRILYEKIIYYKISIYLLILVSFPLKEIGKNN